VGTLHVDPSYDLLGEHDAPRYRALQRRSLTSLDLAIAVSESTASMWRTHLGLTANEPPPTVVIPNGIRLDRLARRHDVAAAKAALGLPPTDLVIGSVGRLDYAKGYIDLIEALPTVLAAVPEVRFVHAGHGPLAETLRREAARLGVESGSPGSASSDVRDLLEAADVYVQPSWCEAQGLGVLEAAALSVPVVATAVGACRRRWTRRAGWPRPVTPPRSPCI
jgi:glycosyltransferase involved in cell wall biosynthesis